MEPIKIDDTPEEVYRKLSEEFECKNCGRCCINPGTLLPDEIGAIAAFLKLSDEEMMEHLTTAGINKMWQFKKAVYEGDNPELKGKSVCSFLSEDENGVPGCTIYNSRPFMCRIQYCGLPEDRRKELIDWAIGYYKSEYSEG
jgi:Fe-S-cluster containining protein